LVGVGCYVCDEFLGCEGEEAGEGEGGGGWGEAGEEEVVMRYCVGDLWAGGGWLVGGALGFGYGVMVGLEGERVRENGL